MASIFKRKQSPMFYAAFNGADGKRVYRSTGTKVKREAQAIAVEWEKEEEKLRKSYSSKHRVVAEIVAKIGRLANEGELTEAHARKAVSDIYQHYSGQELKIHTIKEWLWEWSKTHSPTESFAATESRNRSIRHVLEALGKKAEKRLDLITTEDLEEVKAWLAVQKARGGRTVKKSTQNHKLGHLRGAFREAFDRGKISRNVAAPIKNFPPTDSEIIGEFDQTELVALIDAAEGEWKAGIILAAHTGLRRENIIRLKWTEVALPEKQLHVRLVKQRDGKKPKVGSIPLTKDAFNVVSQQVGKNEIYVFNELSKLKGSDPNNRFNKIMALAKVPKRKTLQGGVEVKRSFHSLRHTFTSLLANRDIAPEIRQELTGHTSSEIHQVYTHLGEDVLREAIGKIPSLGKS